MSKPQGTAEATEEIIVYQNDDGADFTKITCIPGRSFTMHFVDGTSETFTGIEVNTPWIRYLDLTMVEDREIYLTLSQVKSRNFWEHLTNKNT